MRILWILLALLVLTAEVLSIIPTGIFLYQEFFSFRSPGLTYDGSAYFVAPDGNVGGYNVFHGVTYSYGK